MDLSRLNLQDAQGQPQLTYLNDLCEALIRVEEQYCRWPANNRHHIQKIERVFCYELYHQFRLRTINNNNYDRFRMDGENYKNLTPEVVHPCGTNYAVAQDQFSPDFVLHLGQLNRDVDNQLLAIEAKTRSVGDDEIAKTIIKLNHYIRVLNFQFAVFISVNTQLSKLKQKIRRIFIRPINGILSPNSARIIIINYKNRRIDMETLYNILHP